MKQEAIARVLLRNAKKTAVKTAGIFCRGWVHEIPVPKALLTLPKEK